MGDIIIAGFQKCGTTSLHSYLCNHLRIIGGRRKELHFFDDPRIDWTCPNYETYRAQFPDRKPGQMRLDASPSYIYLPHCLERLRSFNPAAHLILLAQDPIERAWSHWSMATRRGRETLSFDAAIRAECDRIAACPPGNIGYKAYSYLDRGFFGHQLARALDIFPRNQILCLASETLKSDPDAVLAQVSVHLGLSPFAPVTHIELNKGNREPISMESETTAYIQGCLQDDIRLFSRLSGLRTDHWAVFQGIVAPHNMSP